MEVYIFSFKISNYKMEKKQSFIVMKRKDRLLKGAKEISLREIFARVKNALSHQKELC